MKVLSPLSRTS
jgi:hypothetical protein